MQKTVILLVLMAILFVGACTQKPVEKGYQATRTLLPEELGDSSAYLIADSVLYDVVIQNPDSLDQWTDYRLRNLDRNTLADMVFDGIYSGKLIAYDYSTEEIVSIDSVKKMEKDPRYDRKKISKMQFEEQWFLDQKTFQFHKKVTAIMLAYEINAMENRYRAGLKVRLTK